MAILVLLPAPLGPSNATASPRSTVSDTSFTAARFPNCLVTRSIITTEFNGLTS